MLTISVHNPHDHWIFTRLYIRNYISIYPKRKNISSLLTTQISFQYLWHESRTSNYKIPKHLSNLQGPDNVNTSRNFSSLKRSRFINVKPGKLIIPEDFERSLAYSPWQIRVKRLASCPDRTLSQYHDLSLRFNLKKKLSILLFVSLSSSPDSPRWRDALFLLLTLSSQSFLSCARPSRRYSPRFILFVSPHRQTSRYSDIECNFTSNQNHGPSYCYEEIASAETLKGLVKVFERFWTSFTNKLSLLCCKHFGFY